MSDKPDNVRALLRGLNILRYINAHGEAKAGEIAKALDIPRPSVYRLLATLEEAGYVIFSASANLARLTPLAASLGDGARRTAHLARIAAPLMAQAANKVIWPLDLTLYENAAMVLHESTHSRSPLSIDRAMIGSRMPMLRTSTGRAYLAFCSAPEREIVIEHLRRLGDPADQFFLEGSWLNRMIEATRARGYALRDAGEFRPQTGSIALPICQDGAVLGAIR